MRELIAGREARSLLLVAVLLGLSGADAAAENAAPTAWDGPSETVDNAVAEWAVNRLRPRSAVAPAPTADGENPLRTLPPVEQPKLSPPPAPAPVAQVRYDETRYGAAVSASSADNPLRAADAAKPAPESTEARLAFADDVAPPPAVDPFATAPQQAEPAPSASPPPAAVAEPRAFEPTEAFQPKPLADSAGGVDVPDDSEPLDFRGPTPAFAAPQSAERIASRSEFPVRQAAESAGVWSDDDGAAKPATRRGRGAGKPGERRLEGPQQASIVVEKRGPDEARVGQTSRFVITVRNTGSAPAENVILRDEAPAGARMLQTIPPATQDNGRLVWRLGSLAPGEERGVEVRVVPTEEGRLGSVATVSFETRASAALRSTKPALAVRVGAPRRVLLGDEQRIQIEVSNPGTGVARNVMLLEDVPDALRHEAGPALELEIGSLAPGETRRMELTVTAAQAGRVVNAVTAIADGDLRAEGAVEFEIVAPSLAVAVDGPKRRYLQRPAKYEVRVANPGTAPAKDVRLVTHLPRGLEFVSANNLGEYDAQTHAVYWSLAELPERQSGAVEVVALPVSAGEHTLRVEGQAHAGLKAAESRRLVVEGMASLAFDIRDLQDPIEVGGEAAYDVVVLNEGTKAASGVRVTIDAPAGMRVVSAQGATAHRQADDRVEFAPIDRLEPGVKKLFRVRLRGERPGDQRVTVAVASDDLRQPIRREESTRVFGDE